VNCIPIPRRIFSLLAVLGLMLFFCVAFEVLGENVLEREPFVAVVLHVSEVFL